MRVDRAKSAYIPVVVILETRDELEELWRLTYEKSQRDNIYASPFVEKLRTKLQDLRRQDDS